MKTIQIRHLIDLVAADVNDGESRIEKIFHWRFERDLRVVRWSLGVAASLPVAILIAYFRSTVTAPNGVESALSLRELIGALMLAFLSATYGLYRLVQLRILHEQYVAALMLFGRLYSIREFIQLYRRTR